MEENITVEPLLSIADNDNELRRSGWASRVEPPIEAFGSDGFQEGWKALYKLAPTRRDREPPVIFAQRLFKNANTSSG
jgi:hypothetical protein